MVHNFCLYFYRTVLVLLGHHQLIVAVQVVVGQLGQYRPRRKPENRGRGVVPWDGTPQHGPNEHRSEAEQGGSDDTVRGPLLATRNQRHVRSAVEVERCSEQGVHQQKVGHVPFWQQPERSKKGIVYMPRISDDLGLHY